MKKKLVTESVEVVVFEPENEQEQKEFDEFSNYLATAHPANLITLLSKESEGWKAIMLAGQILDDFMDSIKYDNLYE